MTTPVPVAPRGPVRRALARADAAANWLYGWRLNPLYHTGAVTVALLAVLIGTGVYLLLFYRIGAPYASVARIADQAWVGRWVRSLHRYATDAAVVAIAVHALRMYAQRRSWGPRVLAWTSGVILLGLLFVCGWTGYVLVWDVQAQLLAAQGARLLDLLPIFSEPISRTFVGERPVGSAFFFINLFLHIALPVGLGLLLWVHVSRVARPVLLPPRRLLWGMVGVLTAAAVLWPVAMAPEADLLRIPRRVPVDALFAFWLPLAARLPAWALWAAGAAAALALLLVPRFTRPRAPERAAPSVVDEHRCTGCTQCYHDCPFEAISMVERSDGRATLVARVDPDLCVSCGVCAGSCAPMSVGPPGRTGRDQLAAVKAFIAERRPGPRDVVLLACRHGPVAGGAHAAELPEFHGAPVLPVQCAGSVHSSVVEYLVRSGAGGVLVLACPPRDCVSREGAVWSEQRLFHDREAELQARVDRRRVRLAYAALAEPAVALRALEEFRGAVHALDATVGEDEIDLFALCDPPPVGEEEVTP